MSSRPNWPPAPQWSNSSVSPSPCHLLTVKYNRTLLYLCCWSGRLKPVRQVIAISDKETSCETDIVANHETVNSLTSCKITRKHDACFIMDIEPMHWQFDILDIMCSIFITITCLISTVQTVISSTSIILAVYSLKQIENATLCQGWTSWRQLEFQITCSHN